MPQPKTVDDYVDALTQGILDAAEIETDILFDVIACLEARQQDPTTDIDGCILLTAAAVRAMAIYKRDEGAMVLHPDCGEGSSSEGNVIWLADHVVSGDAQKVVREGSVRLRKNQFS